MPGQIGDTLLYLKGTKRPVSQPSYCIQQLGGPTHLL